MLVEPVAVGWHALQTAELKAGDTIAVIGLGAIGLLLTQTALAVGHEVMVTDIVPEKMALAAEWGAHPIRQAPEDEAGSLMAAHFETADVGAVFECGGRVETTALALDTAPPGAKIVIVGLAHEPVAFIPLDITRRGLKILTSIIYDRPADFSRTIELISQGIVKPSKAISRRYQFSHVEEALARAASGAETKVVVTVS